MSIIPPEEKSKLSQILEEKLKDPVKMGFVSDKTPECIFCDRIEELLQDVSSLSEKITYEKLNLEKAKPYGIDKAPAIFFFSKPNIRYLGIPSGYEFATFIDTLIHVSRNETDLKLSTAKALSKINKQVHIMIFVTPTCPYCSAAVRTSHMFAIFKQNIISEMVDAIEYQSLANKWQVMAVPKVVINEKVTFEGAYPEEVFVEKILEAVGNVEL